MTRLTRLVQRVKYLKECMTLFRTEAFKYLEGGGISVRCLVYQAHGLRLILGRRHENLRRRSRPPAPHLSLSYKLPSHINYLILLSLNTTMLELCRVAVYPSLGRVPHLDISVALSLIQTHFLSFGDQHNPILTGHSWFNPSTFGCQPFHRLPLSLV